MKRTLAIAAAAILSLTACGATASNSNWQSSGDVSATVFTVKVGNRDIPCVLAVRGGTPWSGVSCDWSTK